MIFKNKNDIDIENIKEIKCNQKGQYGNYIEKFFLVYL